MKDLVMTSNETPEFRKKFGIFVGLFNRENDQKLTVKQALKIPELVAIFEKTQRVLKVSGKRIKKGSSTSTKLRSYQSLNIPDLDAEVLEYIRKNPYQSRRQVSNETSRHLSSVCGAVTRLMDADLVLEMGETKCPETGKTVTLLAVK